MLRSMKEIFPVKHAKRLPGLSQRKEKENTGIVIVTMRFNAIRLADWLSINSGTSIYNLQYWKAIFESMSTLQIQFFFLFLLDGILSF